MSPLDKKGRLLTEAEVAELLGLNHEAVLALVRDGELRAYGTISADQQERLLFTRYEVDHYRHRGIDRAELVTDVEAAQMLAEDATWFYKRWVHTGRVSTVEIDGRRGTHYFLKKEVEALIEFKEKFMTMTEAAEVLGWNRATVHLWTKKGKLKPVSGPGIDNSGHYLYLKEDIINLGSRSAPT